MIVFNYELNFKLSDEQRISRWVQEVVHYYGKECGEINYIFCDDAYLHKINLEYLNHDTFTDIISFDYTMGNLISGDIFISIERVKENADLYSQTFDNELNRVLIHGILHFLGFKDKTEKESAEMRKMEDEMLLKFK